MQAPENSGPERLTPRQKMLRQWVRGGQLLKNDPMRGKKRRWGHDNIGPDKYGASRVEPSQVRGVKKRWA